LLSRYSNKKYINEKGLLQNNSAQKNERGASQLSFFAVKYIYANKPTAKGL
jgi:hypothetical protein